MNQNEEICQQCRQNIQKQEDKNDLTGTNSLGEACKICEIVVPRKEKFDRHFYLEQNFARKYRCVIGDNFPFKQHLCESCLNVYKLLTL